MYNALIKCTDYDQMYAVTLILYDRDSDTLRNIRRLITATLHSQVNNHVSESITLCELVGLADKANTFNE